MIDSSHAPSMAGDTALVLGGGGARGAYQAGAIRAIARRYPQLEFPILTGISAGAINTAFLAAHNAPLAGPAGSAEELVKLWLSVTPERVFRVDAASLSQHAIRWAWRLVSGGIRTTGGDGPRAMVDTAPLGELLRAALSAGPSGELPGVDVNIARGRLRAVALSATSYSTGQSMTWVQGTAPTLWQRPQRRSELASLTIDHVLASSSLPLLFPAVQVGDEWYGDGGIRLTAPLSPALHLGAARILTISTRHERSQVEADAVQIVGYPPPAQILGVLYNAIFLDLIDEDILRLQLINRLLAGTPPAERRAMREVDILVLRPSRDLGRLARQYEPRLPRALRFLTRGWGTRRTSSPDMLSFLMFQEDYLQALIELGEADVAAESDRIDAFLEGTAMNASPGAPPVSRSPE